MKAFRDGGDWVDHRRGIHEQLHPESYQKAQVAILCGQRGNNDAKSKPQAGHDQDQDREEGDPGPVGLNLSPAQQKVQDEKDEQGKLDREGDQVGDQDRDRHRQAREVDLAKQIRVLHEGLAGLGQAGGKVGPDHGAGHI